MVFSLYFLLFCSLSLVEAKSNNDNLPDYVYPSNDKQLIDLVANSDINLFSKMKQYIQHHLDKKGFKNDIPYMNVVS